MNRKSNEEVLQEALKMQGVVEVVIYRERIINHVNNKTLLGVRQKMIIPLEKTESAGI